MPLVVIIVGLALLAGLLPAAARPQAAAAKASIGAYRGLGAWVDMYDSAAWGDPAAAVADMASHGVRTLYLETANYHLPKGSASLYRPEDLARFIEECHARKMKVVAWYVPGFDKPTRDFNRSMAAITYRTPSGQKFNTFALDIESSIVKPASTRSVRLINLSQKIRAAVGAGYPLGAITPSPAGMAINSTYWPNFPFKDLAGIYDVMVPMGYYTYHGDGYTHAYNETRDNVRIIREKTGRANIAIHVIAGLGSNSSGTETQAYVRALRENGCIGGSMYDWATTDDTDWRMLANVRFNPVQTPALPIDVGYMAPMGYCKADRSHPQEVFYQAGGLTSDATLHFRIFDAQVDEVRLLVNWKDIGAIKPSAKGSWSGLRTIVIPADALRADRNVIGFVSRGAAPKWLRWGVRDVTLTAR